MAVRQCVIICLFVVAVLATDTTDQYACSAESAGENALSGFDFLKNPQMLQMVMTSLPTVYNHPGGYKVTCISAITTDVEEMTHAVTLTVYYKQQLSGKWRRFSQRFQFEPDSNGKFNNMTNIQKTGAPSGTYNFVYATLGCAVVTVDNFGHRMSGDSGTDGDSDSSSEQLQDSAVVDTTYDTPEIAVEVNAGENEDTKSLNCMVWASPRYIRGLQNCCEAHFTKHCRKNADHEHTPKRCPVPAVEGKSEL